MSATVLGGRYPAIDHSEKDFARLLCYGEGGDLSLFGKFGGRRAVSLAVIIAHKQLASAQQINSARRSAESDGARRCRPGGRARLSPPTRLETKDAIRRRTHCALVVGREGDGEHRAEDQVLGLPRPAASAVVRPPKTNVSAEQEMPRIPRVDSESERGVQEKTDIGVEPGVAHVAGTKHPAVGAGIVRLERYPTSGAPEASTTNRQQTRRGAAASGEDLEIIGQPRRVWCGTPRGSPY